MTFLSLLAAFLLEQARPHRYPNSAIRSFFVLADRIARYFNGGQVSHGAFGWMVAVLPPVILVALISWAISSINPVLGWVWSVTVLYYTVGFRQVSHTFTGIIRALRAGDSAGAKQLIARWRGESELDVLEQDIAKLTIEEGLRGAHRFVFAPVLFTILVGPAGAVFYRLTVVLRERWADGAQAEMQMFGVFARRAFTCIDWLPSRLTAAGFAIAGNFEDAYYCWRTQAATWPDLFNAPILASGAGALGVKLGGPLHRFARVEERPFLGIGDDPDINALDSTVGLIWRATVIWMLVLLVITIAHWTG